MFATYRLSTVCRIGIAPLFLGAGLFLTGCAANRIRPPEGVRPTVKVVEVTGYCNCRKCCSWERSWLGFGPPVVSKGADKGKPKQIGITASGTRARHGTIAADTSVLPFGTVVEIPGYGYGRVEDRGGAIKGDGLDLWFPSHQAALQWGRKKLQVRIWNERVEGKNK
ncbi:MAG: 3D domain-containing protein [Kiritimatiellae bacterium]|nr:3D domain-containing protein [Kiritimatiellia bacterium]